MKVWFIFIKICETQMMCLSSFVLLLILWGSQEYNYSGFPEWNVLYDKDKIIQLKFVKQEWCFYQVLYLSLLLEFFLNLSVVKVCYSWNDIYFSKFLRDEGTSRYPSGVWDILVQLIRPWASIIEWIVAQIISLVHWTINSAKAVLLQLLNLAY